MTRRYDKSKTVGVLGADAIVSIWQKVNQCQGAPAIRNVDSVPEPRDRTRLEIRNFEQCQQPIRQIVAHKMGHA